MMKVVIFVLLAILGFIHAEWVRMEPSINLFSSRNWKKSDGVDENASVKAIFVLKHNRDSIQQLDQKLMDLSNPSSKNYGKWMSVRRISSFALFKTLTPLL
jgi:hypothetical protein